MVADNPRPAPAGFIQDRMVNGITTDGQFRYTVLLATRVVEETRRRHQLSPVNTHILGRLILSSLLSTVALKGRERVSVRVEGTGPLGMAVAEANALGQVRAYTNKPGLLVEADTLEAAISHSLGAGALYITRVLANHYDPIVSSVALEHGDITTDMANYFLQSDQIPTAIKMGVYLNPEGQTSLALAVLAQPMPDASEENIAIIEKNFKNLPDLETLYSPRQGVRVLSDKALAGFECRELAERAIVFHCACDKDRFARGLMTLETSELSDMAAEGDQVLICHYCAEQYVFTPAEIRDIMERTKK